MGRPREHGADTRAALLAAAGEIVHAEGAAAVSVRRVADAVGTTTRAVYSLFGDKDGLLRALSLDVAETMRRHHAAVPQLADPLAELPLLIAGFRAAALEKHRLYDLFMAQVRPDADPDDPVFRLVYASFDRVLSTIRRALALGLFPGRDEFAVGRHLLALVHGLASLELRGVLGGADTAGPVWDQATAATLAGLTAAGPALPR
ncbi:TetR/AcrR family transcriptional regulator [Dactylosporangium matsuzakiense]|uniref:TetR family transcriptional regulator n=1 Tax=Dactylosporangium matsuzakiense TaxID=53360 RepID=A0A9W6NKD2_9ACTN|nr:TetR/AcrR family transcriptional regulator [Dactylosporangium matsuzakiense]UWZ42036.1 TetR/AcrR family transcriptional regulator [Dactylosporangium matsuzakiense]GLK99651.1 TetR family transcriptional regulator [Dactylosporangium matsuzakiense]